MPPFSNILTVSEQRSGRGKMYRMTIPAKLARQLGLTGGDKLTVWLEGYRLIAEKYYGSRSQ
jgi:antitoxin component of MazEF toxin-antitoxin module